MIKPTVGRVVLFHPPANEAAVDFAPAEICAALVCYVHSDRLVNLAVFDADGKPHSYTSVELIQDGEPAPTHYGRYCEWMPYQKGQAAKTEEVAKAIAEVSPEWRSLLGVSLGAEDSSIRVPVSELSALENVTPNYYFALARQGRAPKSVGGVPLAEARQWLANRAAQRRAKAEATRLLHEQLSAEQTGHLGVGSSGAGAKDGSHG